MIKQVLLDQLRARDAQPGETVDYGWFRFRVCEGRDGIDLETLDFREMASFTRNFDVVERIHAEQAEVVRDAGVEPEHCSLMQYARVDTYYEPGDPQTFLCRVAESEEDFSGWVVGVRSQPLPVNDLRGHDRVSLYQVGILDERLVPFWLLPVEWSVVFEDGQPIVVPPGESDRWFETDDSPPRPWWKVLFGLK